MIKETSLETANSAIEAAIALRYWGQSGGVLMQIAGMRTAAHGLYETALDVRYDLGACRAAARIVRTAKEVDRNACALALLSGLPTNFEGVRELGVQCLWPAWRDLWQEVRSVPIAFSVIAFTETEKIRHSLNGRPRLASHGGTPERIAAHNGRELSKYEKQVNEWKRLRAAVMARLAKLDASHVVLDRNLVRLGYDAAFALRILMDSYCSARGRFDKDHN